MAPPEARVTGAGPTIGARRTRLVIEAAIDTPDDTGGATRSYATVTVVWAQVETLRGALGFAGDQQQAVVTHRVTLPWQDGFSSGYRLRAGARVFSILTWQAVDERRAFIACECEELTS